MKKSFMVIGLGRFGTSTAIMLTRIGHEVLAVDRRTDRVNAVKNDILHVVQADTSDERAVQQLGVSNFDCIVICIGDDIRASVLTTVLCREMGAKKIIAKAQDELHAKLLAKTGADSVVQPERDGGVRLARSLSAEGVIDSLDLSSDYCINELIVPEEWIGKSLASLSVRNRYGLSVIALRRDGHLTINLSPNELFLEGDMIFALGTNKSFQKLSE